MFERLAGALASEGYPCFRFDRRGVGDSEGEDPGFKGSGPDIAAAAAAFRAECPRLEGIAGFGLCDGATALALFGAEAGVESLVLANPWFVEAEAGEPPAAAIKQHYRQQLTSIQGWKKILSGSISYGKLLRGIKKVVAPPPADLAGEVAAGLSRSPCPSSWSCAGETRPPWPPLTFGARPATAPSASAAPRRNMWRATPTPSPDRATRERFWPPSWRRFAPEA
jgi:pimeloyl-ACP methyl ester carboxylesterase